MREGPQLTQVEISPALQTCRSCQSRGRKPPNVSKFKVCKTNTVCRQVRHPFGILCTLQAGSDDCVSSAIVRIPLLVGSIYVCFYELEWLPSRTQTRQRKRPFSYLKRRRRNNYHCCLSVVLCLTAFPHPLYSSLSPPFLSLSLFFTSCFSIPSTICLPTFHLISFCYFISLSLSILPFLFFLLNVESDTDDATIESGTSS